MSSYRVLVTKVMYYDKVYYHLSSDTKLLMEYLEFAKEIGDEAYLIDKELYIDEGAYFNITMKDSTTYFQEQ